MNRPPKLVVIAPNAFKGTLDAMAAARCIARGLRSALPRTRLLLAPVADGGDGTAQSVAAATGGRLIHTPVHDPLGRPIRAAYALTGDRTTAVIEMARASGLALLRPAERNPLVTTTRGTGELVGAALDRGARRILMGIGGSATHDGATGIARALGAKFLDRRGRELPEGGAALQRLARIDLRGLDVRLRNVTLEIACDVDNRLLGPRGAARVYAPQKGASPADVVRLEASMRQFARVIRDELGLDVTKLSGGGAAGGAGAGLVAMLGARLRPGAELVMQAVKLSEKLNGCDLVITGEGRLDGQTAHGKAPAAVARMAGRLGIPVIAICGALAVDAPITRSLGFRACFCALEEPLAEDELRLHAPAMLRRCASQVGRLLAL